MVIPANTVLTIRYAPETGNSENSVHYATQTYFIGDQLGVISCTAHKLNLGWLRLHARDVTSSFTVKPTKEGYTFTLNSQSAVATILNGGIQVLHEGQSFPSNNSRILGAPFPQSNMTNGKNFTPSKDK